MTFNVDEASLTFDISKWDDECMNILVESRYYGTGDYCLHRDSIPELIDHLTVLYAKLKEH
jgi:hypothetical protein